MIKQDLSKWDNINTLEGMLFFAEAIDELLFDHTLDTFKSQALNLHVSVLEVRKLLLLHTKGHITYRQLSYAIEEFEFFLKNDPVVPDPIPILWLDFLKLLKNDNKKPVKLFQIVDALSIDIGNKYWILLKKCIKEAIQDKKRKKLIISLAKSFISETELLGFNRKHVYFANNKFFFNNGRKITSFSQIDSFIRYFDRKIKQRKVIFRCSDSLLLFSKFGNPFHITISATSPNLSSTDTDMQNKIDAFFQTNGKFPNFIYVDDIYAKDEYKARDLAIERLDLFKDVCRFSDHNTEIDINDTVLVLDENQKHVSEISPPRNPMTCHVERDEKAKELFIKKTIEILSGRHSWGQLVDSFRKVIDFHEAALTSKTIENQFLNLWSSFECFLPTPDKNRSRIDYFISSLIPVISLTYADNIFKDISSCLLKIDYNVKTFIKDLNTSDKTDNNEIKVLKLLTCEEFEQERNDLVQKLSFSPLLRNRCYWCFKNFNSSNKIHSTLLKHRKKVTWHIKRIYMTRNQIVHNAECLPYVTTLVENLHSYLDLMIASVVKVGIESQHVSDIDSLLTLINGYYKSHLKLLNKNVKCNQENYYDLLFGPSAPLVI